MADVVLPRPVTRSSWLDRPLLPSWQRLAWLIAHWEILAYGALLAAGFLLRVWDVGGRAMHHDESLHAYYAWKLFVGQGYRYDPLMHGPFQFEVVPLFYLFFGVSEMSARLLAVVMGTALIGLPYFLRHHLTRGGALLAGLMLAISPSFVYYSRFIRDDVYLTFFTLALFVCVVRYLETRSPKYVYIASACMAFAAASMEAAYIDFFILGSFLLVVALREFIANRRGPVLSALRATPLDTWLTATSILVVLTVLMYSTFFTNPTGVWDAQHSLTSAARKDILGGLTYWQAQHGVQRGGQPWFYYLLVIPLYEQLAVLFGVAGLVLALAKRTLVTTFLVWWAVFALGMYSWAGEKMPWLSIHIALPFIVLAGLFLGTVLRSWRRWLVGVVITAFVTLLAVEVHSTFMLNFADAADPTEMLIYVQSSPDVPRVAQEVAQLSHRLTGSTTTQIGLDDADVGGWPFIWYLRDYPNITETSVFNGPVCGGTYCPALIMLEPEFDASAATLMKHYIVQRYRWNWWFPEDYKQWFPAHPGSIPLALSGHGSMDSAPIGTPSDWQHLWNWLVYRQPFGFRGARWMYFLVRRDLVPGARDFSTRPPGTGPVATAPTIAVKELPTVLHATAGGPGVLAGPRDVAIARDGDMYVADTLNHRVAKFNGRGRLLGAWGSVGSAPGQFNHQDSPQGIGVAPNGDVVVADTWNERIQVFDRDGRFLRQWGGGQISGDPGKFYGPRSVAVGPQGRVYVADTGNKRIEVFSNAGRYLFSWGVAGTGPAQFQEPSAVAVAPSGTVYVADFWNQRIQAFTPRGQFLRQWTVPDWTPRSYDEPYVAVDPTTGDVFASDPQQRRILVYSAGGTLLGTVAGTQLTLPIGVAVTTSHRVAVADATADRISVFQLRASATHAPPTRKARRKP